ncbi:MAG TPA: hypothetical protein VFG54_13780 [Prolixibacteraceae bacterium]|nr:hypothetical protein [Prolixibacteraceae bacterium]
MKKILCMILLGLFMISNIHAQWVEKTSDSIKATQPVIDLKAIPKGAWKLVIHTNKSKEENYQLMGETLLEEDYMIDKAIRHFHNIRTFPQGHKKMGRDYILNLVARDSTIVLTGLILNAEEDNVVSMPDYARLENRGMSDSPMRECFREMMRIAMILAGDGEIEYVSE